VATGCGLGLSLVSPHFHVKPGGETYACDDCPADGSGEPGQPPFAGECRFSPKKVKTKGKITAIASGKIELKDANNNLRTFNVLPDREVGITVQGKLTLADLKPGMLVRVEVH